MLRSTSRLLCQWLDLEETFLTDSIWYDLFYIEYFQHFIVIRELNGVHINLLPSFPEVHNLTFIILKPEINMLIILLGKSACFPAIYDLIAF